MSVEQQRVEPLRRAPATVTVDEPRLGVAVRFLTAAGVSFYGDWLTTVALVVLLYRLTGSVAGPALYIVVRVAPRVFGPAPGGSLADRYGPVAVGATCSLLQCALTVGIVVAAHAHAAAGVYVAVAGSQFLNSLAQPAYGALVPRVAPEKRLGRINAIYGSLFSSSILVSPAIGALLLPRVAPEALILADAASFLIAGALLLTLRSVRPASVPRQQRGMAAGLPLVLRDPMLRAYAAACVANSAVITALQAVLVVAAAQHFGRDANVGWLYAAVGAGGLVAGLSFLRPTPASVSRRGVIVASFIELAPLALFVFAPNIIVAVVLLFVSSLGGVLYQTSGNIGLQQRVPTTLLGRVNAVIRMALYVGMLAGAVVAALLVTTAGWQATVLTVAAAAFIFLVVASLVQPRRRAAPHPFDAIPD